MPVRKKRLRMPVRMRSDHHLAGELHARGAQTESFVGVLAKAAQPAMSVANAGAEEKVEDAGQNEIGPPSRWRTPCPGCTNRVVRRRPCESRATRNERRECRCGRKG